MTCDVENSGLAAALRRHPIFGQAEIASRIAPGVWFDREMAALDAMAEYG